LHVVTKKGYGYKLAEADPVKYHAASTKFNVDEGFPPAKPGGTPTFTQVFGSWLCDMAAADDKLIGITPAMREGSGMVEFHKRFPQRYHDVGIAEQHAVTFAAGLACEGLKPVVAIYSTFLQRGYDQLVHDVAIQNLPVVFALDRAGIVGADGPTHAGVFDIAYIRCVPNLSLLAPSDENECRQALTTAYRQNHPVAVRYPRGKGAGVAIETGFSTWPWGQGVVRRQGNPRGNHRIAILAFGTLLHPALKAAEAFDASVADMRFIKPLDEKLVLEMARSHDAIVTVEEGCTMGGAGSAVLECLAAAGVATPALVLGLPDVFTEHGDPAVLLAHYGLDAAGIEQSIRERFGARPALAAVNG
jgi:1-deoxy-D-xylulose-5-phosphate synthase